MSLCENNPNERDRKFLDHLERCAAQVKTWPAWKIGELMSEKKYVVPDGGTQAARAAVADERHWPLIWPILDAFIRWQSENPIVPTDKQANELWKIAIEQDPDKNETTHAAKNLVMEFQRRMYLAPEPELPEEIDDLLLGVRGCRVSEIDDRIKEAFRRGQKAGAQ
jgi:hypothetical protein